MLKSTIRVKVCFLMDCTASMQPWIKSAALHIRTILHEMEVKYENTEFRAAFIGYRDYGDEEQFMIHNFAKAGKIERYLDQVVAKGGLDEAEDVAWALDKVQIGIDWQPSDIRLVYHISDAPAHGIKYHDEDFDDRFPNGDPDGLDPLEPLSWMSMSGIHYTFVRITRKTDIMIRKFSDVYEPSLFNVIDLAVRGPNGFRDSITSDLDTTLTQYISSQGQEVD
jgi:hypothetical protein